MKKFLLFALCAVTSMSVFAEAFSLTKWRELLKEKNQASLRKYAYESTLSSESNVEHIARHFHYIKKDLSKTMTASEILKEIEKFNGMNSYNYNIGLSRAYLMFGFENEAIKLYEKTKNRFIITGVLYHNYINKKFDYTMQLSNKYEQFYWGYKAAIGKKDYNKVWQFAEKLLTVVGGFNNPARCTEVINYMFRYKPANITKQQQIALLEQLAQIYPIPGTDFNKWKGFMGFIGFKYKALTKKDLF